MSKIWGGEFLQVFYRLDALLGPLSGHEMKLKALNPLANIIQWPHPLLIYFTTKLLREVALLLVCLLCSTISLAFWRQIWWNILIVGKKVLVNYSHHTSLICSVSQLIQLKSFIRQILVWHAIMVLVSESHHRGSDTPSGPFYQESSSVWRKDKTSLLVNIGALYFPCFDTVDWVKCITTINNLCLISKGSLPQQVKEENARLNQLIHLESLPGKL